MDRIKLLGQLAAATQVVSRTREPGESAASTPQLQTSCPQVVHVGDSTSIGHRRHTSNKKNWVDEQYRKVGAHDVQTDISGARSIVERWQHLPNAQDAVKAELDGGYQGCWVMAMGTNEAANQAVGRRVRFGRTDRLDHEARW